MKENKFLISPWVRYVVFSIFVLLSAYVFYFLKSDSAQIASERRDASANLFRNLIESKEDHQGDALYSARGVLKAATGMTAKKWNDYIGSQQLISSSSDIYAVAWVERVDAQNKGSYINEARSDASMGSDAYSNFAIHPDASSSEYYIVRYLEPLRGNEKALGFDYRSETPRLVASEVARDSGQLTYSAPLASAVNGSGVFAVTLPVYADGSSTDTVAERRAAFTGLLSAGVNIDSFFGEVYKTVDPAGELAFAVYGQFQGGAEQPIYSSFGANGGFPAGAEIKSITIPIGNDHWIVRIASAAGWLSTEEKLYPFIVAFAMLFMGAAVYLLLKYYYVLRSEAVRRAGEMATSFEQSQQNFEALFNNTVDAMVLSELPTLGHSGKFVEANRAAMEKLGYTHEEMLNLDVSKITSEESLAVTAKVIVELLAKGESSFESTFKSKSGGLISVEVTSRIFELKGKKMVLSVARDIEARKKAETALEQKTKELSRINDLMVGRELKMMELKKENEELRKLVKP